jgi:CheY-like chemotaxis protein
MNDENFTNLPSELHVLVADDDPEDLELFRDALAEIGKDITLTETNDGVELLQKLSTGTPDIIFLDINMPRMNGMDCLASLRELKSLSHIPVIIFSTGAEDSYIAKAFELGANRYIQKPGSFAMIKTRLAAVLSATVSELFHPVYPGTFFEGAH